MNPPMTEPDASRIPRIELITDQDVRNILSIRQANPGSFIFFQFTATFGERLWNLRGMEQTFMDYLLEPTFVHEALDCLMESHMDALNKLLELPIDGVTFCDDFGAQKGLMFSRSVFLEFFKPRYSVMYERVRKAGLVVGHHSCGDNTELMRDFIDMGLQVFHPLQAEAMDIRLIKSEYGSDLTFRGGIGTQGALVFGAPWEAMREIRESVRILAEGGGYLLETCKPLPEGTPLENAMATIETLGEVVI